MSGFFKGKKILAIHFRVGKSDGVSLEIESWKEIWQRMGFKVELCSGPVSTGARYVIPDLEQQLNPEVFRLDEEAFGGFNTYSNSLDFQSDFLKIQKKLIVGFNTVLRRSKPDFIVISNIFSVGENLPAAAALYDTLINIQIPTVCVHHDFYWENSRYLIPSSDFIKNLLDKCLPPDLNFLKHVCINTIARSELKKRKGISAGIMPDTFDYANFKNQKKRECLKVFKRYGISENDLVVLQATRVVRRKNIELSIDFARKLKSFLNSIGKRRLVLVMAGYAEKRDSWYIVKLTDYAKVSDVNIVHLNGLYGNGCKLRDIYPFSDIVTYPSEYEGFGNQFLEAVYYKKPIVLFEYPVFRKDIKPLGFEVISLGKRINYDKVTGFVMVSDEIMDKAAKKTVSILSDRNKLKTMVEGNFGLAKKYYSYEATELRWLKIFDAFH